MKQNRLTGLLFAVFLLAGCGKTVLPAEDGKETQVPAPSDDDDDEQEYQAGRVGAAFFA